MLGTTDAVEYENFDYKLYDQDPMQLDEAMRKASELRGNDTMHFHRIVPANRDKTKFKIESVSIAETQANMWARFVSACLSSLLRSYLKRNA